LIPSLTIAVIATVAILAVAAVSLLLYRRHRKTQVNEEKKLVSFGSVLWDSNRYIANLDKNSVNKP
jgi:biopolymer transport protein ExbB/TolQ